MRPRSITLFAVAYLTYGLVMLVHGYLMRFRMDMSASETLGAWALPIRLAVRSAIVLLLAWGVYFRASSIAKWAAIVMFSLTLPAIVQGWDGVVEGNVRAVVWATAFLIGLLAMSLLFTPASRIWFSTKPRGQRVDARIFD